MSSDLLPIADFKGSPEACGAAYGETFATLLMGFCRQEVTPSQKRLAYARRCWPHVEESAPTAAKFLRGMAAGSKLSLEHVTLLTLHEEICHKPHCTALAAAGEASDGKTLIGQNWDWAPQLYPWAGLLRLAQRGQPRLATYHYPGLWACAGVNEAGLGLVWTGGGYFPLVGPVAGVPTYVLIAEILRQRTADEALAYLRTVKHAGSFIFFLGDATGATIVVEAVPGKLAVDRSATPLCRANHYVDPQILKKGRQVAPRRAKSTTLQREQRMAALVEKHRGRLTPAAAQTILTDRGTDWPWLHQFPGGRQERTLDGMTIDSLLVICEDRQLWTCRGGRTPGPWQCVTS
jgi:hypothetical protein